MCNQSTIASKADWPILNIKDNICLEKSVEKNYSGTEIVYRTKQFI